MLRWLIRPLQTPSIMSMEEREVSLLSSDASVSIAGLHVALSICIPCVNPILQRLNAIVEKIKVSIR